MNDVLALFAATVRGDDEAIAAAQARISDDSWNRRPEVPAAAFFLAVRQRFTEADRAEIVRWVADTRSRLADPDDYEPGAMERLMWAAVVADADMAASVDGGAAVDVQLLVTPLLLRQAALSDADLDRFFAEAESLAEAWSGTD